MNTARVTVTCALAAVLGMAACSSGGGGGGSGGGNNPAPAQPDLAGPTGDLGVPSDMSRSYPAGPYGNQPGKVLRDLTSAGFRLKPGATDSSQLPWETDIKLSDFYYNPACKCILLAIGATWCGACQQEQPMLVSAVGGDPNFCVLGILMEGVDQGTTATRSDVEEWTQHFEQNFPVIQGTTATDALLVGYGSGGSIGLPFSLIVDPTTMKVLDAVEGYDPAIHTLSQSTCNY